MLNSVLLLRGEPRFRHGDTDQHRDQQGRTRHQNRKDPVRDRDHAMTGILLGRPSSKVVE